MASRPLSYVVASFLLFVSASPAFATWSVIAVDQKTREVVIASATCVPQAAFASFPAKGLMDVQAIVVPGKGVAAAQAGVDRTRKNQQLVFDEIAKGTDPARILEMLKEDPNVEMRQFAIVDLQGPHDRVLWSEEHGGVVEPATAGARHRHLLLDPGQHPRE